MCGILFNTFNLRKVIGDRFQRFRLVRIFDFEEHFKKENPNLTIEEINIMVTSYINRPALQNR
jgi:hypothetical protein